MSNLPFNFDEKIVKLSDKALELSKESFAEINSITEYNQQKVLKAFIDNKVSETHFTSTTGYGYSDRGREVLDLVYAQALGTESALVRHNFVSGTHTLCVALFGILRPNDEMVCITGEPYDTLKGVIGIDKKDSNNGSLKDFGIKYSQIDLLEDGEFNLEAIKIKLLSKPKMIYIQRSKGYSLRPSLRVESIEKICETVKKLSPETITMVDNCYGEFVQCKEPSSANVDLIAGSLIKNPGGTIAQTGGYIAGKKDLVEKCACRLTTASTGGEIGATLSQNRDMFMGFFHAPYVVGEALKTAVFSSALLELIGFEAFPKCNSKRADIVQVLCLNNEKNLIKFCRNIQAFSPVDSFLLPEPWDMPGYDCKIIMSSGSFTMGSSIEISADAPLRDPYCVFLQGATSFYSAKIAVMSATQAILNS